MGVTMHRFLGHEPAPHARWLLACALALLALLPVTPARAAEPARCTKADLAKSRRGAEKLYREGRYGEAVEGLSRTKASCWSALEATDRGWLASDLGLAALRAGQPELCRQVLAEAPAELDPASRVAKAIAHNRGLCQSQGGGEGSFPVQVTYRAIHIRTPEEASDALRREWSDTYALRDGHLPQRKKREVTTCTEAEGVTLANLDVRGTGEIYPAQAQLIRCQAWKLITRARPSKVSHVQDLLDTKALGKVLPADFAPSTTADEEREYRQAGREGRSWSDVDPKVSFERDDYDKQTLRVTGDMVSGALTIAARGDFNGDGVEDIMLDRSMGPEGGSLVDMTTFLMSRPRAGGRLTILERMQ
jgi:hypothetical protein